MKRFALVVIPAVSVLAGCTWLDAPLVSSGVDSPTTEPSRKSIYTAVVRELVTKDHTFGGADPGFRVIYVLDGAVRGAVGAFWPTREPRAPFSAEVKRGLAAALVDLPALSFVRTRDEAFTGREPGLVKNHGALVTLGPIRGDGRRAEVGANLWIGGRAAIWLTYVVRQRGDTWRVTGTTGPMAIA